MNSGDTAWILASAALVLLMTPGLAFFYGGLVRRKNATATIMHSLTCMGIAGVVWVLWGYTLAFSDESMGSIFGNLKWFGLAGVSATEPGPYADNIPHQAFMVFQGMFAIITPALITGAFAERMKFSAFALFTVLWLTLVYAPITHWVWGGGWLSNLGPLDFAGGTVVHINAGIAALAAALIIGRRVGFPELPMPAHNVPMVVLGTGLLWFGWFGFNAGSALAADGTAVNAFVVTNVAAAAGILGWVVMSWLFVKKPSVIGAASGAVAGLVAITPAAGFVGAVPAIIIGGVAGVICYWAVEWVLKLKVDDALAVWGVHGMGGTWGALATGLFVGIGFGELAEGVTRIQQVGVQAISILATAAWSFVVSAIILLALKYTIGLRVKDVEEEIGTDLAQHGEQAYTA